MTHAPVQHEANEQASAYLWDAAGVPDEEVSRLERALSPLALKRDEPQALALTSPHRNRALLTVAAALLGIACSSIWVLRPARGELAITVLAGAPLVASNPLHASGAWSVGEWLETGPGGRAQVVVSDIGTVTVEASSRVRLVATGRDEHRLELMRGTIAAVITAPPRLFVVETPVATAVDMGCAYTLSVDDGGGGVLRVTSGWVELEHPKNPSRVPAGAVCTVDPGTGPATPYFEDASAQFLQTLRGWEAAAPGSAEAADLLPVVLASARLRDGLSLWHLMHRTEGADRQMVFDRLAGLVPLPENATAAQALVLSKGVMDRWWGEVRWAW